MRTGQPPPLDQVLDLMLDAVCVVDPPGRFLYVSAACERIFGYTQQEMLGRPMIELVYHEDRARTLNAVVEIVRGTHKPGFENRYVRKDGRLVHIMWTARWSPDHQVRVAVARDVTERKRAEAMQQALYAISEAAHAMDDLPALFPRIHQIVGGLLPAANFCVALYDETREEIGFPYHVDERAAAPAPCRLDSDALSAQVVRTEQAVLLAHDVPATQSELTRPDAGQGALHWLGVPLRTQERVIGALVVRNYAPELRYTEQDLDLLRYVSMQVAAAIERRQMLTRLQHMARHDPLTDLPNRELFHDRLHKALSMARREGTQVAVLCLDLDDFKQVNDSLGHAAGDEMLRETARRLKACVRESDTVGRVGGDEFLVLLNGLHHSEHAWLVADKIRQAVGRPLGLDGHRATVTASLGMALCPVHGHDELTLIRLADEAMYVAKRAGGNRVHMGDRAVRAT